MEYIKGITFGPFASKGRFETKEAYDSLNLLINGTGANLITLIPNALQDTPQSEKINFTSDATLSDDELIKMIDYIHKAGLMVALKPTVNCKNGTWRAYIDFFDIDVHCEPKWKNWFASYTKFQLHFAKIAEQTKCEMFLPGCEMVMSERKETEWRKLIADIRKCYSGLLGYNTDKYQEGHVTWWDCLDFISSSGYYPPNDWDQELDRIEKIVNQFNKPFFFSECGCMSITGASKAPNDWTHRGELNLEEQANWYISMFEACKKRNWINGFCLWDWSYKQNCTCRLDSHNAYNICGKPAQDIVKKYYESLPLKL